MKNKLKTLQLLLILLSIFLVAFALKLNFDIKPTISYLMNNIEVDRSANAKPIHLESSIKSIYITFLAIKDLLISLLVVIILQIILWIPWSKNSSHNKVKSKTAQNLKPDSTNPKKP